MPEAIDQYNDINFVVDQETASRPTLKDQIFEWTIQRGRTVIIITATLVLALFIARSKLNMDINSTVESIAPNKTIIENSQEIETKHKDLQVKIAKIDSIIKSQIDWGPRLKNFDAKIPNNITKDIIAFKENTITLTGGADTAETFRTLIVNLLNDETVESIVLEGSSYNRETAGYGFIVKINLKPQS